jgi:hypothetical protein
MRRIAADKLGELFGLSEAQLHELTRHAFSVSTRRGLIVPERDVELWRAAVDAAAAVIRDLEGLPTAGKPPRRKGGVRGAAGTKAARS